MFRKTTKWIKDKIVNIVYKKELCTVVDIKEKQFNNNVYNIEVEDNHNYFANGLLVSNCHKFRNAKTQRMQIFDDILDETKKDIKKIWLLTGTPIDGKPLDYFNLLKLIKHPLSKNWRNYVIDFCNGYVDRWGRWNTSGHSNLEKLHAETKGIILRRLKSDVAKDLPNKERKPVWLHLENTKGYNAVVDNYIKKKIDLLNPEELEFVKEDPKVSAMVKLILRRQFLALEKVKDGSLVEVINNELDKDSKILVFTNFTKVVDAVYDSFKSDSLFIDGRTDAKDRIELLDKFNRDASVRMMVLNLKVGSVGLNAQAANSIIINDMDWVPSTMLQAEDRAYRIGQLRDVLAQYLLYKDTVDEILYETVSRKMQVVSTVLEGKESQYFTDYEKSSELSKESILKEIFAQLDRF
jgi:SWI/SNF-related matrix-associated actin-dependent regulator 1 of chromatin subfamily A